MSKFFVLFAIMAMVGGCKTKDDLRQEQDLKQLKVELEEVKSTKVGRNNQEDLKKEILELNNLVEENYRQMELLKDQITALNDRLNKVETTRSINGLSESTPKKIKPSIELGKKLFDQRQFVAAADVFKNVLKETESDEEARTAQWYLAESYFLSKEYASAALEYAHYRKNHPKDKQIAKAIYRQAMSFENLGKTKESELFYKELLDKHPKSEWAKKTKRMLSSKEVSKETTEEEQE